jgi:hypothetical protein
MNRKVSVLLTQLSLADPATSEFLDISKKIADAVRIVQKEKAEKPPKEPKPPKPKAPRTVLCDECYELLFKKIDEITD